MLKNDHGTPLDFASSYFVWQQQKSNNAYFRGGIISQRWTDVTDKIQKKHIEMSIYIG